MAGDLPRVLSATSASELPQGWEVVQLRHVADSYSGGTPPKSEAEYWRGPVPWLSPKDMKATHLSDTIDHISAAAAARYSRVMPAKTIFVVIRGMILAKDLPVAMSTTPMAFNQDMKALCANDRVISEYLLYAIIGQKAAMTKEIGTTAHGTRRIGSSSLDDLNLPLPPLPEQRAIVSLLSLLRTAIVLEEKRVAALRGLKAATMAKVFREGLRGERTRETVLGELPESWKVSAMGDIVTRMNYGTSAHCGLEPIGAPVLRIPNVIGERIDETELKYAVLPNREADKLTLTPGDILFVRTNGNRNYTGRCAVYEGSPQNALFASYLIRVRLQPGTLAPHFVKYFLSSTGRSQITSKANPAADGKFNVDTGILRGIILPTPSEAEQEEIVALFSTIDGRLAKSQRRVSALRALYRSTLEKLMIGALRVTPLLEHQPHTHA
jgi:type I restriction enzyme S subunit